MRDQTIQTSGVGEYPIDNRSIQPMKIQTNDQIDLGCLESITDITAGISNINPTAKSFMKEMYL